MMVENNFLVFELTKLFSYKLYIHNRLQNMFASLDYYVRDAAQSVIEQVVPLGRR